MSQRAEHDPVHVCRSTELSNIKLRRSEKKQLNEVNHSDAARYHVMHASKASLA